MGRRRARGQSNPVGILDETMCTGPKEAVIYEGIADTFASWKAERSSAI